MLLWRILGLIVCVCVEINANFKLNQTEVLANFLYNNIFLYCDYLQLEKNTGRLGILRRRYWNLDRSARGMEFM